MDCAAFSASNEIWHFSCLKTRKDVFRSFCVLHFERQQSRRGARGGKGPTRDWIIAIKNVRYGLFDERSEIFRENLFSQKMWRF